MSSADDSVGGNPALEFRNVSFSWAGGRGLCNVSFSVPGGQFVLISGPSGAGKSTLLRLAVRLEEAEQGQILLDGEPLDSIYPPLLRSRISYVQQTPVLLPGTVRDNLLMPFSLRVRKDADVPADSLLQEWMERLDLGDVGLASGADELSVGQRQRVCLIRSILTRPEVICFDEPTSALDQASREKVEHAAEQLAADGVAVLMVNHTGYRPGCPHLYLEVSNGKVGVKE